LDAGATSTTKSSLPAGSPVNWPDEGSAVPPPADSTGWDVLVGVAGAALTGGTGESITVIAVAVAPNTATAAVITASTAARGSRRIQRLRSGRTATPPVDATAHDEHIAVP
jgi:hypothetical protein